MDMDPLIPKAVWGFNGTERPGAVYLAAVLAGHNQKGLPAFSIYGRDVQDVGDTTIPEDVQDKLLRFARAGLAVATMRGKSYLAMGGVSMGIVGSIVDQPLFEEYLGMRVETVDMSEFTRRMEEVIYDPEEFERALVWVKENCPEGKDYNPPQNQRTREQKDADWEISVKMALIARDLMVGNPRLAELGFGEEALGHNAIAAGFQGQRQWTDHYPNGDFMEAILNTSFDWNGIREPYILATENDALNGVCYDVWPAADRDCPDIRRCAHLLEPAGGQTCQWIRTGRKGCRRHSAPDQFRSSRSGRDRPAGSGWNTGDETLLGDHPRRSPALPESDELARRHARNISGVVDGRQSSKRCGGMPVTMCRLNLVKGLGPAFQIAEGYTVDLPDDVHAILDERTNPTWPTTWFVPNLTGSGPFRDVYTVMANWGANHGAISYGHIGSDLITLASMLRIPVYMHNVSEERIFRPHAWTSFGANEPQGADFRACANFGALYG